MGTILDVAVGLTVVYALFAVVCSAVNELVAGLYGLRASMLQRGLSALLGGAKANDLLKHALVAGLNDGKVSYVPAHVFVAALFDRLSAEESSGEVPSGEASADGLARLRAQLAADAWARRALLPLLDETVTDVKTARSRIERWFDDAMTRLSGQYKRHAQRNIFLIALTVCGVCNIDSFQIARSLYRDAPQREALVVAADRVRQTPYAVTTSGAGNATTPEFRRAVQSLDAALRDVKPLDLPIGWIGPPAPRASAWLSKLLGLLFSVVAISLGAPFWFELMNKFLNLRAAGTPPPRSDEGAKDAKA